MSPIYGCKTRFREYSFSSNLILCFNEIDDFQKSQNLYIVRNDSFFLITMLSQLLKLWQEPQ